MSDSNSKYRLQRFSWSQFLVRPHGPGLRGHADNYWAIQLSGQHWYAANDRLSEGADRNCRAREAAMALLLMKASR